MEAVKTPTLIIGAGPSGLAIGGRLRHRGLAFEMIESSDRIAPAWHAHYDRLRLHTVKELSELPHLPFPIDYPRYVARASLIEYYDAYADHFGIHPHFGETAFAVRRNGGQWCTTTSGGREFRSTSVVLATGVNRVPHQPEYPGMTNFRGEILHSRQYRNPQPFVGRRVLVVGMGNTGAEIALDLCEARVSTTISIRGPVNIVPRDVLGRPTQLTARMLARLPERLGDQIGVLLRRLTVGRLDRYGIATPDLPPLAQLRIHGKTPVIDVGTVAAIKSGRIAILGAIQRFDQNEVVFTGDRRRAFDSVIFATGYRARLEDLLDDTTGLFDRNNVPASVVGTGRHAGLYFLGFDNYQPGGILGTVHHDSKVVADAIERGS